VTFEADPEDCDDEDDELTGRGLEAWALNYDALNGAPEGEWDR
jgi:hypothetical protein